MFEVQDHLNYVVVLISSIWFPHFAEIRNLLCLQGDQDGHPDRQRRRLLSDDDEDEDDDVIAPAVL